MFKENFKAAFGLVTGLAAGIYFIGFIDNLIGEAKKQCKEETTEKQAEEKSKADEWVESIK